jgi:hypothetical protein
MEGDLVRLDGFLIDELYNDVDMNEYNAMYDEIRRFSHEYKSNSNNSKRLKSNGDIGIRFALMASENWSRRTEANNNERLKKITGLPTIQVNPLKCFSLSRVRDSKRPVYFSGSPACEYGKVRLPENADYIAATEHLDVVDSTEGFYLKDVCVLMKREEALKTCQKGQRGRLYNAFTRLAKNAKTSNSRAVSQSRKPVLDGTGAGKYVVKGWFASRNKRGLSVHEFKKEGQDKACELVSGFFRQLEDRARGYIDARHLLYIEAVRHFSDYGGLSLAGGTESAIWPSVAFGRNVFLNVHRDEDYFWSLTTIVTGDKQAYERESRIVSYFCFPTYGFCVALRPGDVLMFNALVDHCASSVCFKYEKAFGISLYLKTAVVAGNDNRKRP